MIFVLVWGNKRRQRRIEQSKENIKRGEGLDGNMDLSSEAMVYAMLDKSILSF